jgi:hypothetical protein
VRGILGVLPLAILSAGCSLRPWTPSVSVAFWSEDVPPGRDVILPPASELARRWQLPPQSPWAPWSKGTLISAVDAMGGRAVLPDVTRLGVVAEAHAAAVHLAKVGLPEGTLWVVDLRGAASAVFAARLSRDAKEPIAPVVTFNNWPSVDGLVPAEETLAGLVAFSPHLPPDDAPSAHPVFALDSWRLAYRFDDPGDDVYDNRYMLMPGDLPDAATLRARGISRVVYVVEDLDDAEVEEDDLHPSFRAWQAAGIAIHMVDLPFLKKVPAPVSGSWPVDWAVRLAPQQHRVRDRYTLVDDPFFYARARAGFGLMYGRPFWGAGWWGPGGYRGGGAYRGGGGG